MPNILISTIEKGTRVAKSSGKTHEGLWIKGTQLVDQHNYSEKPWEKFYPDFEDEGAIVALFNDFKAGDAIKITNKKEGRFYKVISVEHMDDVIRHEGEPAPDKPEQGKLFPDYHKGTALPVPVAADTPRETALDTAVRHIDSLLSANEKYKSLFKATITPELIEDMVISTAENFVKFLEGATTSSITSDAGDVEAKPAELDEPQLPPD